jgi:glycosyltransferase involved in cell wall biosynthesis
MTKKLSGAESEESTASISDTTEADDKIASGGQKQQKLFYGSAHSSGNGSSHPNANWMTKLESVFAGHGDDLGMDSPTMDADGEGVGVNRSATKSEGRKSPLEEVVQPGPRHGQIALPNPADPSTKLAIAEAIAQGDSYRSLRNWAAARDAYSRALLLDSTLQSIWMQFGHAAKEVGDPLGAEAAYRKAIDLNPGDADAYLELGHALKMRGLMAPATECYSHALLLNPDLTDAHAGILLLERADTGRQNSADESSLHPYGSGPRTMTESTSLTIVFDVSDLMNYFHKARLPTGIQRVQIEVIKGAMKAWRTDIAISLVCFTKHTDFWVEIPASLFQMFCKLAVSSGDTSAPEWVALLTELKRLLESRKYYRFPQGSVLLNLGTSWWLQNYFLNVRLAKSLSGIKYIPFVHDFIPAVAEEHCTEELRQDFMSWAIGAFDHADYFFVNSKATLKDLRAVGGKLGHTVAEGAIVTLDADFRKSLEVGSDPLDPAYLLHSKDLQKENYVLFVATVESRKNHIAAFSVWLKLLKKYGARQVPKLVCVGNDGWLNDAAYSKLRASELLSRHVVMLQKISDAALAVLYENCLCTLYPSSYEGWGLPVTEALCFGKVPIVSNSSSLPEAGGEFAEYFDVESEKDMLATVERVIFDEDYRRQRERRISETFRARSWAEISQQVIQQLKEWHARPQGEPKPIPASPVSGIWPMKAELNELHMLSNSTSSGLWPGLQSGEMYRNGMGWWWPEPWGTWIKNAGPAYLAFRVEDAKDCGLLVYIGLRGVQGKRTTCTLKVDGVPPLDVHLRDHEDKVVKLRLPAVQSKERLVVISATCTGTADFAMFTNGVDTRIAGIGVRWFYACKENDLAGRLSILEGLSLGTEDRLQRQAPAVHDFLLAAQ